MWRAQCGPDKIAKIEVEKISHILSELNLMTYDLHGSWDVLTGINAPMFDQVSLRQACPSR